MDPVEISQHTGDGLPIPAVHMGRLRAQLMDKYLHPQGVSLGDGVIPSVNDALVPT